MSIETLQQFDTAVRHELENNIIPFWLGRAVDSQHGGFISQMSNDGIVNPKAPKGLILNTRILWAFSALYRFKPDPRYQEMAQRANEFLQAHFWDRSYGGTFWLLDFNHNPVDNKKKIYGQAFYIYALAEFYQAFENPLALDRAAETFELIETHSRDTKYGGYIEVCNPDWSIAEDLRLSDKDMDEKKSMNNHLHLLEAYTNLYRIWPDNLLQQRLTELIHLFDQQIMNPVTGHLYHFFDESWQPKSDNYTFGHDIEASWLLCEAAEILKDENITSKARRMAMRLAHVTLSEGLDSNGGLCYEGQAGKVTDPNRQWWPQAESVVGFLNAYELSGEEVFLESAKKTWTYIEKHFVDTKNGEWFWRVFHDGRFDPSELKVSQWKGPYHNVRACLEIIKRLSRFK